MTNLDRYAKAYGWDRGRSPSSPRPASVATAPSEGPARYTASGRASASPACTTTTLAAQIGMTTPPATLADFEQLLAKAKSAGLLPIMINGKDGGSVFPLQNLAMDYGGRRQAVAGRGTTTSPARRINTPATVQAATTLQQWSNRMATSPADVNEHRPDPRTGQVRSRATGVFFPSGNWQAPGLDKAGAGQVRVLPVPAAYRPVDRTTR